MQQNAETVKTSQAADNSSVSKQGAGGVCRPFVVFSTDGSITALDVDHVLSVESIPPITPVPDAPPYIAGVVNLQGNITAVVNLARLRSQQAETESDPPTCIVMALLDGHPCGLLAVETHEVHELSFDEIAPPLPDPTGLQLIQGLAQVDGDTVSILDAERLTSVLVGKSTVQETNRS